jgi:hypothetical protein
LANWNNKGKGTALGEGTSKPNTAVIRFNQHPDNRQPHTHSPCAYLSGTFVRSIKIIKNTAALFGGDANSFILDFDDNEFLFGRFCPFQNGGDMDFLSC